LSKDNKLESSKEYKEAIEKAKKYKPEDNKEEVTGYTSYSGSSRSDKQYPILFNFIISLLLQIIEKLNTVINILGNKKDKEDINVVNDIDKITEAINKLNIEDIKIDRKPKPYTHWSPRK
jgi:hypothetical protein